MRLAAWNCHHEDCGMGEPRDEDEKEEKEEATGREEPRRGRAESVLTDPLPNPSGVMK